MLELLILSLVYSLDEGVELGSHWWVRSQSANSILWLVRLAPTDWAFFFLGVVEGFVFTTLWLNRVFSMVLVREPPLLVLKRHRLDLSYNVSGHRRNRLVIFLGEYFSAIFFLADPVFVGQKVLPIDQGVSISGFKSLSRRVLHWFHVKLAIIRAVMLE